MTDDNDDVPASRHSAFDRARTRHTARAPGGPAERCRAPAGTYRPEVNRGRCEGKGDCVAVCPYGVFEIGRIDDGDYRALPPLARLKVWAHGKKTALTPAADACQACGLCVVACPEKAITLVPAGA